MFWSASQATWPETWMALPKGVGTIATWAKPYGRLSKIPAGTPIVRLMTTPWRSARNRSVDPQQRPQPVVGDLDRVRPAFERAEGKLQMIFEEDVAIRLPQHLGEIGRADVGADNARQLAQPVRGRQEHALGPDRLSGTQVDQRARDADDAVGTAFVGIVAHVD